MLIPEFINTHIPKQKLAMRLWVGPSLLINEHVRPPY